MNNLVSQFKQYLGLLFLITMLIVSNAYSDSSKKVTHKSAISFNNLHVVLPPPVAGSTSVYGTIKNDGDTSDTLINIKSNAGMVMLHQSVVDESGQAQMNHIESYELKPNQPLTLKPMSYHIMLMNLNHDIVKQGGKVKLSFTFKGAGLIEQIIPVLAQ